MEGLKKIIKTHFLAFIGSLVSFLIMCLILISVPHSHQWGPNTFFSNFSNFTWNASTANINLILPTRQMMLLLSIFSNSTSAMPLFYHSSPTISLVWKFHIHWGQSAVSLHIADPSNFINSIKFPIFNHEITIYEPWNSHPFTYLLYEMSHFIFNNSNWSWFARTHKYRC